MKLGLIIVATLLVMEVYVVNMEVKRERAYHDKIYNACIADHELQWYCDAIAWQATRARYP